ncbi:B-type cell cycle switch protein ccs52A-like, partial [Rutidosis leptorrhynchoides]|uniref:B-type cell cycle switch protein ccs52A-like n=1 Tax=Rutidosis leptorrhynchoides TaxID=125765 RepID=UPI003A99F7D8
SNMNNENYQTPLSSSSPSQPKTPNHYMNRSPSRTIISDRFIPSRSSSNFALFGLSPSPPSSTYNARLREALFGSDLGFVPPGTPDKNNSSPVNTNNWVNPNIFRYKTETKKSSDSLYPLGFDDDSGYRPAKPPRIIPRSSFSVLDAPELQDDFYLNLLDWSSSNVLAAGLGSCVYLWNASSRKVTKLCDLGMYETVCSVGWSQQGTSLAFGSSNGEVQIWDASLCKRVRTMEGHSARVGTIAWSSNMLSSGSSDKSILQRDPRAQENFISKLTSHKSDVCGLKWSYDDRELASGGGDHKLFVWNQHSTQPIVKYNEHTAAVKAIAWSPHRYGLLASGGGSTDRCIRFWNTTTNSHLNCMDTGSQVCNLVWSKNVNELVSKHGFSKNQIIVWRYPTMSKLATITGRRCRVLYLAISPDGQSIVTGAEDERLRFWNVFPSSKSQNTNREAIASSFGRTHIR